MATMEETAVFQKQCPVAANMAVIVSRTQVPALINNYSKKEIIREKKIFFIYAK